MRFRNPRQRRHADGDPVRHRTARMSRIRRCQNRHLPGKGDRVLGLLLERAHRSLDALSELRAIFDGLCELAGDPRKPVTTDDIAQTRRNLRELTKVGEREIYEAVLSCTRARRQFLNSVPITKRTRTDRIADGPSFWPMVIRPTGGSSGCSGCVSDQCVETVGELIIVPFSKEGLGRGPLDAPHPPSFAPVRTVRANIPLCVEPAWQNDQKQNWARFEGFINGKSFRLGSEAHLGV
jgi:hypothetical protein